MFRTEKSTEVRCPVCKDATLRVRRFCLRTTCFCPRCQRDYTVAELVPRLDEADVARLQQAVGDHLSDRV